MTLDERAVLRRVRELAGNVEGIQAAYSMGDEDDHRIPEALAYFPAAVVLKGADESIEISLDHVQRHWALLVQVYFNVGNDLGFAAANLSAYPERFLRLGMANSTLGGRVQHFRYRSATPVDVFVWAEVEHIGQQMEFLVIDDGVETIGVGT